MPGGAADVPGEATNAGGEMADATMVEEELRAAKDAELDARKAWVKQQAACF